MRRKPMISASVSCFREFGNSSRYVCRIFVRPKSTPNSTEQSIRVLQVMVCDDIRSAVCLATTCPISAESSSFNRGNTLIGSRNNLPCASTAASPSSSSHTGRIPVKTTMIPIHDESS
jgi:hypothetical protein